MQDFVYKTAQFLHFLYIYAKIRTNFIPIIIPMGKKKCREKVYFLGKKAIKYVKIIKKTERT